MDSSQMSISVAQKSKAATSIFWKLGGEGNWRHSTADRVIALHMANPESIPGIPKFDSLVPPSTTSSTF